MSEAVPGLTAVLPVALRFVAYYRVSTDRQGKSGLGLEAQRAAVAKYVAGAGGVVAAESRRSKAARGTTGRSSRRRWPPAARAGRRW